MLHVYEMLVLSIVSYDGKSRVRKPRASVHAWVRVA